MTREAELAEFAFIENDSTSGLGGLFAEKYEFVRSEKWFTFKAALNLMHQRRTPERMPTIVETGTMRMKEDPAGGCLTADALVLTADRGPVPINEIVVGDIVYSFRDGGFVVRPVTRVIPQGRRPVYRLTTGCRSIEATGNHPFLRLSDGRHGKKYWYWTPLNELKPSHQVVVANLIEGGKTLQLPAIPTPVTTHGQSLLLEIPVAATEDFVRVCGFFVGDGYLNRASSGSRFNLCEPAAGKFREKYSTILENVFHVKVHQYPDALNIASTRLSALFERLGFDKPCDEKVVPEWVFGLPLSLRLAFIEGYCDADGHYRKAVKFRYGTTNPRMDFCCCNARLMEQIRLLCIVSGLRVSNLHQRLRHGNIRGDEFESLSVEFFARKPRKGLELDRPYIHSTVRSVDYAGEKETYDIEVAGTHNFIANGVIVHNSTLFFGEYCKRYGGHLYTVDIDAAHMTTSKTLTAEYAPWITYAQEDSVGFLGRFDRPVDFLYLDALDCNPAGDSTPAQEHQVKEFQAAKHALGPDALILLDDNNFAAPSYGKTRLLKRVLPNEGWECIADRGQSLWQSKMRGF